MFSTEEFIEASRDFVCIRIETYENKQSEELVKRINGRLANTAFAILNPDGSRMLTRGSRSPSMSMSNNRGKTDTTGSENSEIISKMMQISNRFASKGDSSEAELQDFHSLRQALNCASADQRLLVFVNASDDQRDQVTPTLKRVFADEEIIGKFHIDFVNDETDQGWNRILQGSKNKPSIVVVRSGKFGLDGQAVEQLPIDASEEAMKDALLKANAQFAKVEVRKEYESHVRDGRRQRINFENEIPRQGSDGTGGKQGRQRTRRR